MAIPLIALAGAAAAAGLAGAGGGAAAGLGKNTTNFPTFGQTQQYDPTKFQYGGLYGGADADANRMRWWADQAQTRGAPGVDYSRANQWDQAAGNMASSAAQARGGQDQLAQMMTQRAMGNVPSIAGMQARQDMGLVAQQAQDQARQAQAAQMAGAASARGAAGMALAQQNAANNISNANGMIGANASNAMRNIANQAEINAANERMQAEQAAYGAYSGLRQGDISQQGMAFQGSQNAAQQAQYNAGLGMQQRGLNDAMTMGMSAQERAIRDAQLNAGMSEQQMLAQSYGQQQNLRYQETAANANREMDYLKMGVGAVTGAASMAAPTGGAVARAGGGPVSSGRPYLVGERGPEVIVPQSDGLVIPNHMLPHREEGGPVQAGQPTVVGEKGKELLISEPTMDKVKMILAAMAPGGLASLATRGLLSPYTDYAAARGAGHSNQQALDLISGYKVARPTPNQPAPLAHAAVPIVIQADKQQPETAPARAYVPLPPPMPPPVESAPSADYVAPASTTQPIQAVATEGERPKTTGLIAISTGRRRQ